MRIILEKRKVFHQSAQSQNERTLIPQFAELNFHSILYGLVALWLAACDEQADQTSSFISDFEEFGAQEKADSPASILKNQPHMNVCKLLPKEDVEAILNDEFDQGEASIKKGDGIISSTSSACSYTSIVPDSGDPAKDLQKYSYVTALIWSWPPETNNAENFMQSFLNDADATVTEIENLGDQAFASNGIQVLQKNVTVSLTLTGAKAREGEKQKLEYEKKLVQKLLDRL